MRAPKEKRKQKQQLSSFKPLGVGDGVRTNRQRLRGWRVARVSNPSEWGTVRAPGVSRRSGNPSVSFKPLGVGDGARTIRIDADQVEVAGFKPLGVGDGARTRAGLSTRRPNSVGFKPLGVGDGVRTGLDPDDADEARTFQTPRSGGRCAHQRAGEMIKSIGTSFKPLGVGDGARTAPQAPQGGQTIPVSNPSEWGTVRAPCLAWALLTTAALFQTPRSGGRCAHHPEVPRERPVIPGFKPLGVGDGAHTSFNG